MSDLVTWLRKQLDWAEVDAAEDHILGCKTHDRCADPEVDPDFTDLSECDCPARARLLDVEAKRRILDLHGIKAEPVQQRSPFDPFTGERREPEYNVTCEICGWVSFDATSACPTLRLLALPYADREGYDEAWRP